MQYKLKIGDTRQSVRVSSLYESIEPVFQLEVETAVMRYANEEHCQEFDMPQDFAGRVEYMSRLYEVTKSDLIRYCLAWYAGWCLAHEQ